MTHCSDAWAAGLFDGEGYVQIHAYEDGRMLLNLCVTNTHRGALEVLQAQYGGCVTEQHDGSRKKRCWIWKIGSVASEGFAQAILPHSVIKQKQLEVYLVARQEIDPRGGRIKLTATQIERRHELDAEVRAIRAA